MLQQNDSFDEDRSYVNLVVRYRAATEDSEDEAGPIIRYYFKCDRHHCDHNDHCLIKLHMSL